MDYPLWLPKFFSGGLVIACISIVHVFVAQFAVGMGLYMVVAEHIAIKNKDSKFLSYIKSNSALILLIAAVFGATTGVGIWFSIALVSPAATSVLIHNFVWIWASEWIFFVLEIVSILLYYYTWGKISAKLHITIGWFYFVGGIFSLILINGIITFQLTPGNWISTHDIWDGYFNPTFLPSTIGRIGISILLAAVYATLVISFVKDIPLKKYAGRYTGFFLIIGTALIAIGMICWVYSLPEDLRQQFMGGDIALTNFYKYFIILTTILFLFSLAFTLLFPKYMNIVISLLVMAIGLSSVGYYEFLRERVRKPYIIRDYMYSNGILLSEVDKLNKNGVLAKVKWANIEEYKDVERVGEAVFRAECNICHGLTIFNPIIPKIQGLSAEDLYYVIDSIQYNPLMPPFIGTEEEKSALSVFLAKIAK